MRNAMVQLKQRKYLLKSSKTPTIGTGPIKVFLPNAQKNKYEIQK